MMNYKDAWKMYSSVTDWHQSGRNTTWAYKEEGNTLYLFFQGSYERFDWIRDCMVWPKKIWLWDKCEFVHKGFYRMVCDLYKDQEFMNLPYGVGCTNLVMIGYSSGGTLALLLEYLEGLFFDKIEIYTFAAPRVYWLRKYELWWDFLEKRVNVRIKDDWVPNLFAPLGYRKNPGDEIVLKSECRSPVKNHLPSTYDKAIRELDEVLADNIENDKNTNI